MLTNPQIIDALQQGSRIGPQPRVSAEAEAISDLRRGRPPRRLPNRIALVERNGLVSWEWGPIVTPRRPGAGLRRAARRGAPAGNVLFSDSLPSLGVNQIGQLLADFDQWVNPAIDRKKGWKLRQWHAGAPALGDPAPAPPKGKVLLIVHGTASSCEHVLSEIQTSAAGAKLLADAAGAYQAVLVFDHPTISVSPFLNAMDLARALEPYSGCDVDIVCHSRGGLVSKWWMHVLDDSGRAKRCVFVGSTLGGTNLVNPARLRGSLHLLANFGKLLGNLSLATGFLTLPMTIIKVIASVVDKTASLPLLDAALAMIPGLNAQGRTDNNAELQRLNERTAAAAPPKHFFIQANFNSQDPGWKIWKYVTEDPLVRAADAALDWLVFPGKNDLIVDTDSMLDAVPAPAQVLKFDSADGRVHHLNYFEQVQTIDQIRKWLAIP